MGEGEIPKLSIACSSTEGRARLERAAAAVLGRMPRDLAIKLATQVMVFGLDRTKHQAFVQGYGAPGDATGRLAAARVRHGASDAPITIIVISLDNPRPNLERVLAHECGHVALGHSARYRSAAASLTDEEVASLEQEAESFAERYTGW